MARQRKTIKQRIAAVRAFHAGLIADVQRLQWTLHELSGLIERLRRTDEEPEAKVDVIKASCAHVEELGRVHKSSRSTYRDLKRAMLGLRLTSERIAQPRFGSRA
jgi:hypothetical protein